MLDRRALALVCLYGLFGFGHESIMAGVLPLVVIERGGDAAFVGLLVAAYGIPTILLRPLVGRVMDTPLRPRGRPGRARRSSRSRRWATSSRACHDGRDPRHAGLGWAAYGTGGHAVLARVAPAGRRSEAAGYYNAMPALSILLGPADRPVAVANVGAPAPFIRPRRWAWPG